MKKNDRYTSIVITSFVDNKLREDMFRTSLESLLETTSRLPVEIIVVLNDRSFTTLSWLDSLLATGAVQCLVLNSNNMHFGFARNQGLAMAHGNYLVVADNDIFYERDWLKDCLTFLEKHPDNKIYTSFIDYPTGVLRQKYWQGELDGAKLSMRAGSNCWVMRRKDFEVIGGFKAHRIAGTKWTDEAVGKGYLCAVLPGEKMKDLGLRQGYNHGLPIPIKRTLRNGEEVFFNQDEFTIPNQ